LESNRRLSLFPGGGAAKLLAYKPLRQCGEAGIVEQCATNIGFIQRLTVQSAIFGTESASLPRCLELGAAPVDWRIARPMCVAGVYLAVAPRFVNRVVFIRLGQKGGRMTPQSMRPPCSMNDPDGETKDSQKRRSEQRQTRIEWMRRLLRRSKADKNKHYDSESTHPDGDRPPKDS
jgi:hypothetical protein